MKSAWGSHWNSFAAGLCTAMLLCMLWVGYFIEPILSRVQHSNHQTTCGDKGCRTDDDVTCEKFLQLMRRRGPAPVWPPGTH